MAKVRMNIELSEEAAEFLDQLAKEEQTSKTEILRRALSVLKAYKAQSPRAAEARGRVGGAGAGAYRFQFECRCSRCGNCRGARQVSSMSGNEADSGRETIDTDDVLAPASIRESKSDIIRTKAAAWISGASLLIGSVFLVVALVKSDTELRAWATGLISLVVGAAIGYAFTSSSSNQG